MLPLIKISATVLVFMYIGYCLADSTVDWYKSLGNFYTPRDIIKWYIGGVIIFGFIGFFISALIYKPK